MAILLFIIIVVVIIIVFYCYYFYYFHWLSSWLCVKGTWAGAGYGGQGPWLGCR